MRDQNHSNQCSLGISFLTIQPTYNCNLGCRYCYLDGERSEKLKTATKIGVTAIRRFATHRLTMPRVPVRIVFHGGEPLLLGHQYFEDVLNEIRLANNELGGLLRASIQTNLTLLDEEYCRLFKRHNVALSTSVDGGADSHDYNRVTKRGAGTFAVVAKNIGLAQAYGLKVGALCLITAANINNERKLLDNFSELGVNFKTNHLFLNGAAVKNKDELFVTPLEYGLFLCRLFDLWYDSYQHLTIGNLMQYMALAVNGPGAGSCTSGNCAISHLTISPNGDCYTCGRATRDSWFKLGNVIDDDLSKIVAGTKMKVLTSRRPESIEGCSACVYSKECYGGCMYEAYLNGGTIFVRDGNCDVFKTVYPHVKNRVFRELGFFD